MVKPNQQFIITTGYATPVNPLVISKNCVMYRLPINYEVEWNIKNQFKNAVKITVLKHLLSIVEVIANW